MATECGGAASLGLLSTPYLHPRAPKCYMQARCMAAGCPGGSRRGKDLRTRAGRYAGRLGHQKKLGHPGDGGARLKGSMPGRVRRRQASPTPQGLVGPAGGSGPGPGM